jgi:hypothetical protein
MHGRFMRRAIALAVLPLGLMLTGFAGAAPGDFVAQVTFSQDCGSGLGVGVAYDGAGHLWVSCYASNPDLLRASASTGTVDQTYNIENGLGALAYDSTRNALWAGPGCGNDPSSIQLIQLDATRSVTGSAAAFVPAGFGDCLDDGIAYDATNDSIYYSPDGSTTIGHFKTDGTSLGSFGWTGSGCYNSGLAIGGTLLFQGSDGCSHVWVVDKTTLAPAFDFNTSVAGDPNFRDEGLSCDTQTFSPKQVMWSKEAYSPNRAAAFEIPAGTCGVGGQPPAPPDCSKTSRLVGTDNLTRQTTDEDVSGSAEAFRAVAGTSGTANTVCIYVAPTNAATALVAGIYADNGTGHPGALLAQGTLIGSPTNGAFNGISVPSVALAAGTPYWITVLSPLGSGTFRFRDHCCGYQASPQSGPSENSKETNLAALPAAWTTGKVWPRDGLILGYGGS